MLHEFADDSTAWMSFISLMKSVVLVELGLRVFFSDTRYF